MVALIAVLAWRPDPDVRVSWQGERATIAWKETLGRNFPPSTLLYIGGLVDVRAKVEIEVTAFVPGA